MWDKVALRNILNSTVSVKYFTVAWADSGIRIWVFLYNVNTKVCDKKSWNKNMGQSLFKKHSIRFFTVTWPNLAQIIGSF